MADLDGDEFAHELPPTVLSCAIDDIALLALRERGPEARCHGCDGPIVDEPAGKGLFVWTRGQDVQIEEPPLCARCATAIGVSALRRWDEEEQEEG